MKQLCLVVACLLSLAHAYAQPAFPGAEGFGAGASGGRGGRVVYVTNLNVSGPGSLQEALNLNEPRYILFKVSGVIQGTVSVPPGRGNFTIAGQTSPGGIVVRGLEMYNDAQPSVSNIIIRHVRSRIGDRNLFPTSNWLADDGITLGGLHNGIIDHCSFAHAGDEAVDISRSSQLTIQYCQLAETLGGHAYLGGMLINYSDAASRLDSLSIHHNIWNRIGGRMPEISCETPYCAGKTIRLELSNNLFWDPQIELWYEGVTGFNSNFYLRMNAVNNLSMARPSYGNGMFHHDLLHFSQNSLYFYGNRLSLYPQLADFELFYCCNDFPTSYPNTDLGQAHRPFTLHPFPTVTYHTVSDLPVYLASNAGAFPRDSMDTRLNGYILNNNMIDLPVEEGGASDAFILNNAALPFADTDNDGMPDYWESSHGTNPAIQDHNGTGLSQSITGVSGYTNLECYLNCLSDALVAGSSTPACGIQAFTTSAGEIVNTGGTVSVFPNPASGVFFIRQTDERPVEVLVFTMQGALVLRQELETATGRLDAGNLPPGCYFLEVRDTQGLMPVSVHRLFITR
ncbi:MAG: T9SS type A sorting domain-containing protein [Bacteroidota bacterium]